MLLAVVAVAAAAAGYGYNAWRIASHATPTPGAEAAIASTRLPDLGGSPQALAQWRGKVVVLNFWATWCAPCREEIPLFVKLQDQYGAQGLQFVGVAIDQPEKVKPYAAELGMNFPILIGGVEAIDLTRTLGNRASVLPFTVILGRDGRIVSSEIGATHRAKLEPALVSQLSKASVH